MSVANQANEKLTQLVSITKQIESYLNPNSSKKGEKGEKGEKTSESKTKGPNVGDTIKEAIAIGGMATSIAKLIIATNVLSSKAGVKVKDFLVNFSEGVAEAAKTLKDTNGKELMDSLVSMSKSLTYFAVGMAAIGILSPLVAIGTIVFVLAVKGIIWALKSADDNVGKGIGALDSLMNMSKSLAWFALGLIAVGIAAPLIAIGTLVFILAVKGIIGALKTADDNAGKGASALATLMSIGKSIAVFALTMVGIALVAPLFAVGVLVFILAIKGILWALNSANKNAGKGASALDTLMKIGKYIFIFALTMVGIGFFAKEFAIGALVFILAIVAITKVLNQIGKDSILITRGIHVLKRMTIPLLFFGAVMGIAGLAAGYIALGALALGLSIGFIGLAAYMLGKYDKTGEITRGTVVLDSLAVPMIAFAVALAIIGSLVKDDPAALALKVAVIGGAIVVLGLAAYVLGQPEVAIFAEIGAGVLITLGAALVIFAGALWILSKAEFTKEKADNLGYAIGTIGLAVAKLGLLSIGIALGTVVMIPMSLALIPFSYGLKKFKEIDWQETDGESLKNALYSVVHGFAHALDGIGVKGLIKAMAAIPLINSIGNAMVSLAAGVKAMATLSFTEMEYDKATNKLVPKRVVKLTDEEIQAVGPNTAMILSALAMPLTNFGMWAATGTYSFGPFSIGSGYMQKGIEAAAGVGAVISSLAKGVADMANLNVIEYEVRKGKIVPVRSRKLTPADFILAGVNTGLILSTLAKPLSKFGEESEKGEGLIWGVGYVEKGVEAAGKVGNVIGSIAKGVSDMANLNIVEYEVRKGKLVPISTRKLAPTDFTLAADNVGLILTTLTEPLTTFGKNYKEGSYWFKDSALEAGIEATGKIVDPIAKMADMIVKLAGGQVTVNEVINPGTKDAKLVPKGVISFADAVPAAIANVKKLLFAFPQAFANLGIYINKWEDEIDTAVEFMPKMADAVKDILSVSKSYLEITKNIDESSKTGKSIDSVLTGFASSLASMGKSFDKLDNNKVTLYKRFASITEGMTKINTPFEKFTKNFGQFTKDMGIFVKVWDAFGKDDAANLKTYADSLKTIASVDAGKLSATTQALKAQAQAQAVLNNSKNSPAAAAAATAESTTAATKTVGAGKAATASSPTTMQQAAPAPPAQQPGLGGSVIARLEVTNLYLNGKLQK